MYIKNYPEKFAGKGLVLGAMLMAASTMASASESPDDDKLLQDIAFSGGMLGAVFRF